MATKLFDWIFRSRDRRRRLVAYLWGWMNDAADRLQRHEDTRRLSLLAKSQADDIYQNEQLIESLRGEVRAAEAADEAASRHAERQKLEIEMLQDQVRHLSLIVDRDRNRIEAESSIYATLKTGHGGRVHAADVGTVKDRSIYGA